MGLAWYVAGQSPRYRSVLGIYPHIVILLKFHRCGTQIPVANKWTRIIPSLRSQTDFAVKVIILPSPSPSGILVDIDEALINWRLGKRLPNVISLYDSWKEQPERLCIRRQWTGTSLQDCLRLGWRFSGQRWLELMSGIANGLGQAHRSTMLHGDLKPSNSCPI